MSLFPTFFTVLAWFAFLNGSIIAANLNTTSVSFRIMAVGASVTFGVGSTTGDSYRKDLQDLLTANNNKVEYVGSKKNGNFSDNAVEATPGFVISQIAAAANAAVPQFKPNLVLIDAGTNNCNNGGTVPDAGANITNMINTVFEQSPGATVILTTILVNSVAKQDACRVTVNAQYSALATKFQTAGAKMVLVDMRGPDGPLVTDLADGRHPNDAGYVKMANVWFQGIQEVVSKGFLTTPSEGTSTSTSTSSSTTPEDSGKNKTSTASHSGKSKGSAKSTGAQGAVSSSSTPEAFTSAGMSSTKTKSFAVVLRWISVLVLAAAVV